MKTKCQKCGKEMKLVAPSHRTKRNKYCSRDCYYQAIKAKTFDFDCNQCGKVVRLPNWRNYIGKTKYFCNNKCWIEYRNSHPEYRQPFRHKILGEHPVLTKKILTDEYQTNNLKMRDIAKKYNYGYVTVNYWIKKYKLPTRKQKDYLPPAISEGHIKKNLIRIRGNRCEICGWDKGRCDVHHKISKCDNGSNDESNLIVVCPNDHRLISEGKLKI